MGEIKLNPSQYDAVHADGPVMCCAGPGSGKTRVVTERTLRILEKEPGARIILVTFSREAANEMVARIKAACERERLPPPGARVVAGTYHALALRQLRQSQNAGRILGSMAIDHLTRSALASTGVDIPVDAAAERIALCKMDSEYAHRDPEASKLAEAYQKLLTESQGWDFTDLMVRCVDLLESEKMRPLPANHILCDEYQDIDRIQARWLYAHLTRTWCRSRWAMTTSRSMGSVERWAMRA